MNKYYFFVIVAYMQLMGCSSNSSKARVYSFNNKWGVAYYFNPRFPGDGCKYAMGFLPFADDGDTLKIKDNSSIFDFKYKEGISFISGDQDLLYRIHGNANPVIYERGDNHHVVYWAFIKIGYHLTNASQTPKMDYVLPDTLYLKNGEIPIKTYSFGKQITIDNSTSKKAIRPLNNNKSDSTRNKLEMPCILINRI